MPDLDEWFVRTRQWNSRSPRICNSTPIAKKQNNEELSSTCVRTTRYSFGAFDRGTYIRSEHVNRELWITLILFRNSSHWKETNAPEVYHHPKITWTQHKPQDTLAMWTSTLAPRPSWQRWGQGRKNDQALQERTWRRRTAASCEGGGRSEGQNSPWSFRVPGSFSTFHRVATSASV